MSDPCPHCTLEAQANELLAKADKTALIHLMRALITTRMWDLDEKTLRDVIRDGVKAGEWQDINIIHGLNGNDYNP